LLTEFTRLTGYHRKSAIRLLGASPVRQVMVYGRGKGQSLTKPLPSLKSRIPIRTFYTSGERKTPGFWQTGTVHH
jgi:hypothetical protein